MPAMEERGAVCYTVTHEDLIDFAHEIIERTKEMNEAENAEIAASDDGEYYTRKKVMTLLKRCDSTMTKWAKRGYLVPVRVGGKHLSMPWSRRTSFRNIMPSFAICRVSATT